MISIQSKISQDITCNSEGSESASGQAQKVNRSLQVACWDHWFSIDF